MNKYLLIVFLALAISSFAQKEKFQVNGAGRAYLFANELDIAESLDTVSTRKANYGHTLLDLGFSIFPNEETEIISIFRIRNELGGFWGGGVSFNVRQLTLRGVAGGIVKYELGDIDLSMTPYTLYNFTEEGVVNEADAFSIRRDIVHYDMFYNENNTWRMQGAKANFGLEFPKIIKGIDITGFITRQRATDGILIPERLYGGGTLKINQSKDLSIAFNSVNVFDLTQTIRDSVQYTNNVYTSEVNYSKNLNEKLSVGLKSEGGMSNAQYKNYTEINAPEKMDEWFYDAAITSNIKKQNISLALGYKDVGADFLSPGAQTRRVNFSKFPGIYKQFTHEFIGRQTNYFDVISGNSENSIKISEQLLPYYAAYNNTNPYGLATPNRKGIYLDATREDSTKIRSAFVKVAALTESRGTGTLQKKLFLLAEAGADVYLNDFIGWNKMIKLDVGIRYENTSRNGEEFEKVNLSSILMDGGISLEFAKDFDLLFGAKLWSVNGNEFYNQRNAYNIIENFQTVHYNFIENTYAAGLRYRFNDKNQLSAQYQLFSVNHSDANLIDYGIGQFNILFSLFF
ncbi:MAG: hypothetical protein ACLGGV_03200 [Bacteroidia bacterium]